ncbi:MAG: purine-nucleoside phosphorylase [Patescibacteria group bacterium]
MDSKQLARRIAEEATYLIEQSLTPDRIPAVALVLGTGWGGAMELEMSKGLELENIRGFENLKHLPRIEGHERVVVCGDIGGKRVIALRGRIHLNEDSTHQAEVGGMVRLQIEMLLELGVKRFILTNAAGSLRPEIEVGSVVMADSFVSLFAPAMPLFGGEFCCPQDRLSSAWREAALEAARPVHITVHQGAYAMLRGPQFEGTGLDKKMLRDAGAAVVGMSTYPEMCVIATRPGTKALCLSFVTNTDSEAHSHEENQARAKEKSAQLGALLRNIVEKTVE